MSKNKPCTNFILEMFKKSNLKPMSKIAIMADLGNINHNFNKKELFESFRDLYLTNKSYKYVNDFGKEVLSFINNRYKNLREELGHKIMQDIVYEADEKENKEKFEKENEKKRKKEHAPLAKAIKSKGYSQDEAADILDVDKSTISRIKTGTRKPSFDLMRKMSIKFGKGIINQLLDT